MTWRHEFRKGGDKQELAGAVLNLESVSTNGKLTKLFGRACTYNLFVPRGFYQLAIGNGSLDKSISEAGGKLPLLLFHDWESFPIGMAYDWDSTKTFLDGAWEVFDDERSQDAARRAQGKQLTGLSVGVGPILSSWEINESLQYPVTDMRELDKMTMIEGRLLETSLTPTPAIASAQVSTVLNAFPRQRHAGSGTPKLDLWKKYRDTLNVTS